MNIRDMNKKPSVSELRGNLAERFNLDVALENYTFNELVEMKEKLVEKMNKLIETNSYNYTHKNQYQKNRLFVQILEAEIEARRPLVEGEEMRANLIVGMENQTDKIKGWMQDTNELKSDELLEYTDMIRDEMGADTSAQFAEIVNAAVDNLYVALQQCHDEFVRAQAVMLGNEAEVSASMGDTMGTDDTAPAADTEDDLDLDLDLETPDDEFGATSAAAGGEEPEDRARRESVERLHKRLGEGNLSTVINKMHDERQAKNQRLKKVRGGGRGRAGSRNPNAATTDMSEGNIGDPATFGEPKPRPKQMRKGGQGRAKAAGKADPRATDTTLGGVLDQERRVRMHQQKKRVTNPANYNTKDGM